MNTGLVNVAIDLLPSVFQLIREAHAQAHPGVPAPDDAAVVAALNAAIESSVLKDDRWLHSHQDPAP